MGGIERNVEPCRGEAPKQGKSLNPNCPPVGPKSLKPGSKNQKTLVAVRGFSCTFAGRRPCLTVSRTRQRQKFGCTGPISCKRRAKKCFPNRAQAILPGRNDADRASNDADVSSFPPKIP